MHTPDLTTYDRIIVMCSGGADSIATLLAVVDGGATATQIELWHHEEDGRETPGLFAWPFAPAYVRALGAAFGVPVYASWRAGGIEREMLRDTTATARTFFETPHGLLFAGGHGPAGTRQRFPQQSADLSVRWCSAYAKIMVADTAIRNQARLWHTRTLVVTGERAEESAARAGYAVFGPHRADARDGRHRRHVDHWRPVHHLPKRDVWRMLAQARIVPATAYAMGWGRLSCAACIFSSPDGWASLRQVLPEQFARLAAREASFAMTLRRDRTTLVQTADRGTPFAGITPERIAEARATTWDRPIVLPADQEWALPIGATHGDMAGPG